MVIGSWFHALKHYRRHIYIKGMRRYTRINTAKCKATEFAGLNTGAMSCSRSDHHPQPATTKDIIEIKACLAFII